MKSKTLMVISIVALLLSIALVSLQGISNSMKTVEEKCQDFCEAKFWHDKDLVDPCVDGCLVGAGVKHPD